MNSRPDAIVVDHLKVVRGERLVLPDLSVRIPEGQVTGLLGPSGSGKSTLIRAIVGVQIVAGGTITVLGQPAGSAALRRDVAYVTQSPSVYADLTVRENTRYFARLAGADAASAEAAIDAVDLRDHADQVIAKLSGGQTSRTSLAAALVGDPKVLVLDEPTVGLDPVLRRDLWGLFHRLADAGKTLLVSSHVMDEASRCDRLILLRDGRILADEAPADLLQSTGQPDAESAFLHLIDTAQLGDTAQSGDTAPSTERSAS